MHVGSKIRSRSDEQVIKRQKVENIHLQSVFEFGFYMNIHRLNGYSNVKLIVRNFHFEPGHF